MSVIIFLAVLSVLIIVHEAGHFATAKALGVKVDRFAVGFGPKLFSRVYKGTEFAACLFPLGGYVKMTGDERAECKGTPHEYYSHPPGHRALIVLFGPIVNYLMAFVCFFIVFLIGYPTLSPKIGEVVAGHPAQTVGLQTNDKIIRINAADIESWEQIQKSISTSKTDALDLTVVRNNQTLQIRVLPRIENIVNIFGQKESIRIIGIKPKEEIILLKYGVGKSLWNSFDRLVEITTMTYKALYRMATGAMSPKDSMTGPIGIFYIIQKAASMGISYLLYIVAIISASLAIFNLLPLPVLDGGHLFLLGVEKFRHRPLSPKTDEIINRTGLVFIIGLAVFIFYNDVERYGLIDKFVHFWQKLGL